MRSFDAALARLRDPASEVSAHWLIAADGQVWRLVDEAARAWHAGVGAWGGARDLNSRSIGIELDNAGPPDLPPFPEAQMAALETLLDGIAARWSVPPDRVIGHSDMAPGRKTDPGPKFDWRRLARGGRAIWPDPSPPAAADWPAFQAAASIIGYRAPADDRETVLRAFRLRFRPWAVAAPLEGEDLALAAALAAAHPCVDAVAVPT